MATHAQRLHIAATLQWAYDNRGAFDYPPGDQRTNRDGISWSLTETQAHHVVTSGGRLQFDCSEFCPWVLKCAGCWHWPTPGYTGSHLELLPVYHDPRHADVGALVVFGPGTGHHESIVWEPDHEGGNPVLCSHGRPGMDRIRLKEEQRGQTLAGFPGVRMLAITHL